MEENKVAQMTKHTDSSRSTDSGVSGNGTGAERRGLRYRQRRQGSRRGHEQARRF
jgi:hypothetical protein